MPAPTITPALAVRISSQVDKAARRALSRCPDVDEVIVIGIRTRDGRLQAFDGHTPGIDPEMAVQVMARMLEAYLRRGVVVSDEQGNSSTFDLSANGGYDERKDN